MHNRPCDRILGPLGNRGVRTSKSQYTPSLNLDQNRELASYFMTKTYLIISFFCRKNMHCHALCFDVLKIVLIYLLCRINTQTSKQEFGNIFEMKTFLRFNTFYSFIIQKLRLGQDFIKSRNKT